MHVKFEPKTIYNLADRAGNTISLVNTTSQGVNPISVITFPFHKERLLKDNLNLKDAKIQIRKCRSVLCGQEKPLKLKY